jgi:hypothetical protein
MGMMHSAHDGELLAAARVAEALRKRSGLTWDQVSNPPPAPAPKSLALIIEPFDVERMIGFLRRHRRVVAPHDVVFLRAIKNKRPLSQRHTGRLMVISSRVFFKVAMNAT